MRIKDRYQYIISLKEIILLNVNNESMLIEANLTHAKHFLFESHTKEFFFLTENIQGTKHHIHV